MSSYYYRFRLISFLGAYAPPHSRRMVAGLLFTGHQCPQPPWFRWFISSEWLYWFYATWASTWGQTTRPGMDFVCDSRGAAYRVCCVGFTLARRSIAGFENCGLRRPPKYKRTQSLHMAPNAWTPRRKRRGRVTGRTQYHAADLVRCRQSFLPS